MKSGAVDIGLEALHFQFGRYLLISSSRPGDLAANLQGIWNDSLAPSWDSKYTININTEMNYWPAEVTNLSEMHEPLFDLVDHSREDGRRVAKAIYGARGFVIHHNTDAWGHASPIDDVRSGLWAIGRRMAVAALLGSLRLHPRPGIPSRARLSGAERSVRVSSRLSRRGFAGAADERAVVVARESTT